MISICEKSAVRSWLCTVAACIGLATSAFANPTSDGNWSFAGQFGVMTDDRAAEALNPSRVEFVDKYLLGVVLGYDRMIGTSRFSVGAELQFNAHFGGQRFWEAVLPLSVRYHPQNSWGNLFDSFAFGLGLSHYSEISQLEALNYNGTSRRTLIYWYLETEFAETNWGDNFFFRLHHRSNGYDTLEPNGGSNALVLGLRRRF